MQSWLHHTREGVSQQYDDMPVPMAYKVLLLLNDTLQCCD